MFEDDNDYDESLMLKMFQTLDFKILEEIRIQFRIVNEQMLLQFLVPSLINLELIFANVQNENILEIVLLNAVNLRKLKCTWQLNVNPLKTLMKFQRSTKLNFLNFYGLFSCPTVTDVADFIIHHMESNGNLSFFSSDKSFEAPFEYEKEIRHCIKSKTKTDDFNDFIVMAKYGFY